MSSFNIGGFGFGSGQSDFDWQMQQVRTQMWVQGYSQQQATNRTNELLEKIRRHQLTPAERAAEDQQRAAEAKAKAEQCETKQILITLGVIALMVLCFIGLCAVESHPVCATPVVPALYPEAPTPQAASTPALPN